MDSSTNSNKCNSQPPPYSESPSPANPVQPTANQPPPGSSYVYPQPQQPYPGPPAGYFGYYPQAPMAYPAPPPAAAAAAAPQQQQQQQQQQSTVVVAGGGIAGPSIVQVAPVELYSSHRILACVVIWCCNAVFGFVAWILAGRLDSITVTVIASVILR